MYVIRKIYEHEKTTDEIINLAEGIIPTNKDMWCDSAEPDRIKEWKQAGYRARPVKIEKTTDKKYQATQIGWLK
ncbi:MULTISPECIES: hypothetical protein [unclassified Carnobacterium]|uniref:hypothetical protein n=1 Tax=unclassified Carnobacterium TaxID=257487 RepID=UPI00196B5DF3|nr:MULTISPECIES: hypothetical protein [unclassified Carnobacterium]